MQYTERPIYVAVGREMEGRWRKREEHLPRNKMAPRLVAVTPVVSLSLQGLQWREGGRGKVAPFREAPTFGCLRECHPNERWRMAAA